jgi:hypothetical protein
VLHGEIHVGGTYAVLCFVAKTLNDHVLPLSGKSSPTAEFRKLEAILPVVEILDLPAQLFFGGFSQRLIVISHAEVYLVDDLQKIDLKLHGGEQRPVDHNGKLALLRSGNGNVIAERVPKAQKLHVVILQEANGTEIFQLVLLEAKLAKMIDLRVDLLHHFLGEDDALVSALEIIFPAKIGVLMEDHLIHIEFI